MKTRTETIIEVSEWDKLVQETYGRPYSFQQQEGCQPRGLRRFSVPDEAEDFKNDFVPEKVNGEEMGVSFEAWKSRDPKQLIPDDDSCRGFTPTEDEITSMRQHGTELWWERNFYPEFQTVANDLHAQGKLDAGEYTIDIDW